MGYDGEVIIKTTLEEKGIDKGIVSIEAKMEKLREKAEEPYEINGVKITGGWNLSKEEQQYYDRLEASLNKLQLQKAEIMMADKQITQEVKEQTEAINKQIPSNDSNKAKIVELSRKLEEMLNNYNAMKNQDIVSSQDVKDAKELRKEILEVKKEYEKLTGTKLHIKGITNTKKDFSDIGNSISGTIKKVGRWAMAVFGVRSAYMAIRNAMNVISANDEQLKADIEYMKTALAYTLEPIVRRVVELAKQLMFYVGYIVKAWTGKDIFANANKGLESANKKAKELKKTTASFDEMNIISDNSSSGSGSVAPSFDLSAPEDMPVPTWLQWIADNKEVILATLGGIAGGLAAIKLGASGIMGLGIGVLIAGVILLIQDIIDLIDDPSWENFVAVLGDIAVVIGGIMLVMGNWWGLLVVIIGLIVKLVAENWDKVKAILGEVGNWIYQKVIKPVSDFFTNLWNGIVNGVKSAVKWVKDSFKSVVDFFSGIISKIVGLFRNIGTKVGDAIGNAFKLVVNGVLGALEKILNAPIKTINKLIDVINKIPGINLKTLPTFNLPKLAVGGIVNNPGKGVPIGGALTGEVSKEGVIPLTNSQAMEELGRTIGQYITINANITNTMNGRVISRELQKVNANSDFAFNR